jgi:IS5 family transposase
MVKVVLLQQWYGLSDPRLEEALSDTLSWRRFAGLGLNEGTPDHSTISRFRAALRRAALDAALFAEVARQLEAQGLILKQGTLMDATLVAAQARRPPLDQGAGAKSPGDADADWTRKGGKSYFGYKAHVAVDAGSGLIRHAILTPAKTFESEVADRLVCGDERAVYGDKAYEHKGRRARLKAAGIKDRIMHRSHKNQAGLPHWQRRRNRLIAPIRAAVERVFGTLKRSYGYRSVRYYTLAANTTQLLLLATAYNLRRAAAIAG